MIVLDLCETLPCVSQLVQGFVVEAAEPFRLYSYLGTVDKNMEATDYMIVCLDRRSIGIMRKKMKATIHLGFMDLLLWV